MASHLSDGCHKAGERVNCSMEVYLSVDFGKVWKPVTSYVAQFDWGPSLDGVLKAGMQKESMFLVTYEKKEGAPPPRTLHHPVQLAHSIVHLRWSSSLHPCGAMTRPSTRDRIGCTPPTCRARAHRATAPSYATSPSAYPQPRPSTPTLTRQPALRRVELQG